MFDGQFFPGEAIQFHGGGTIRNPWRKRDAFEILTMMGLASGLQLCLDAGDSASYSSGQKWLDLSGNGHDFFLGADGSATATDPTFNGSAGALSSSEYFSADGGDYFTHDAANPAWVNSLHQDSALFWMMGWFYFGNVTSANGLFGTNANAGANVGMRWTVTGSGAGSGLGVFVTNGAGSSYNLNSVLQPGAGAWRLCALTIDEAAGSGLMAVNTDTLALTPTYSAPSAGSAAFTAQIGARGNAEGPITSGSRMAMFMAGTGVALTAAQIASFYTATRGRFGV